MHYLTFFNGLEMTHYNQIDLLLGSTSQGAYVDH